VIRHECVFHACLDWIATACGLAMTPMPTLRGAPSAFSREQGTVRRSRHCEEHRDEAIQLEDGVANSCRRFAMNATGMKA
jgi:hypothetical protein